MHPDLVATTAPSADVPNNGLHPTTQQMYCWVPPRFARQRVKAIVRPISQLHHFGGQAPVIEIRAEKPEDIPAIRQVHQQAFQPRLNEAHLVELLRQAHKTPVSMVALSEGRLVGHVLFSPITFVPAQPTIRGLGLAPIGVLPEFQKQGIGSKLIAQGLQDCQQSGYDLAVVLGDPHFYSRFGFSCAKDHQLGNEYNADAEFMVMELRAGALRGVKGMVKYQPEFKTAGC